MKKLFKVSFGVIAGLLLFATGAYASNQGWLNFTGDEQVQESESNVNEIMEILRNVHKGKLDAEEALAELEQLNPKGLVKKIKSLEEEKANLQIKIVELEEALANAPEDQTEYVKHLEKELNRANQLVEQLKSETDKALEEAKTYE